MDKKENIFKYLSLVSQVGLLMAIPIIGCMLFGIFLDNLLNTKVVFLIVFTLLGVLSAFRNLYVIVMKTDKMGKKDGNNERK